MSFSFSATAPIISPEQEKEERLALDDEERAALEADLHPNQNSIEAILNDSMDEASIEKAVSLFHEALDLIPEPQKAAYIEAAAQVPELIERESNPLAFLRCEKWNAWSAAHRFVEYWKLRKYLFKDRAYLPMTLDGALLPDIPTLEKGLILPLPPDDFGRPVTYVDRAKIKKGSGVDLKSLVSTRLLIFDLE